VNKLPEFGQSPELVESKKGQGVTIHNYWIRHSQKVNAEVFNADKTAISNSSISAGGAIRAQERGKATEAGLHGAKGYKSNSKRTQETFDALMAGYAELNSGAPIREGVRIKQELFVAAGTPEFLAEYDQKSSANKKRLLAEGVASGKYPDVEFAKLTPDQQEEITEEAEEPVVREWIDNPDSKMAASFPPRIQATKFAKLFDRHSRLAKKLNNGSEVDLFHNTHKTVTEPFLASGVLRRKSDNERITTLQQIGGSLRILDQWESTAKTDEQGNLSFLITIRGEQYGLDNEAYQKLLTEGTNHVE